MKLLSAIIAFTLLIPSAEAAVISTTKQKKLPTISDVRVEAGLKGFRFDVVKSPTTNAYDIWMRLEDSRGEKVGEWFVKSMKLRHRSRTIKSAVFKTNLADLLYFERSDTYVFTTFVCPANLREPNRVGCATSHTTLDFVAEKGR